MRHPFDLPQVKDGYDLIDFFEKAIESLKEKKSSLKIDGVNASFKLVTRRDGTKEFVGDRYSLKPIDIEGITADNAFERFGEKEDKRTGEVKPHGMIEVYTNLLAIMNESLRSKDKKENIIPELQILGAYDNPTLIFNTEYVSGKTNVKEYGDDFLAIHNIGQIYEKKSRPGSPRPSVKDPETEEEKPVNDFAEVIPLDTDQKKAMKSFLNKVGKVAKRHNFKIFGTVPVWIKEEKGTSIDLNRALEKEFTVVYDKDVNDAQTKSLREWLYNEETGFIAKNPRAKTVMLANGKRIGALTKEIYIAILNKKSLSHFLRVPEGVNHDQMAQDAVNGAVFYEVTRVLGKEILNALDSGMGDVENHEGVVLLDKKRFTVDMVKITGDFILGGMVSAFRQGDGDGASRFRCAKTIALVPGGYKPPHAEHLGMIKHYTEIAHEVKIFISPLARGSDKKDQYHVTEEMSLNIWKLYLKTAGLSKKADILLTKFNTPVKASTEWIVQNRDYLKEINERQGNPVCIILGASTKLDDKGVPDIKGRFDRGGIEDFLLSKDIPYTMVEVPDPALPQLVAPGGDMSGTGFREVLHIIATGKGHIRDSATRISAYDKLREFTPDGIDTNKVLAILGIPPEPEIELEIPPDAPPPPEEPPVEDESEVHSENKKKGLHSSILYGLIDEILNERDYQKESERITDYLDDWREMHATGPQNPGSAYPKHRPGKRSKSGPVGFAKEEIENDEEIIREAEKVRREFNSIEDLASQILDIYEEQANLSGESKPRGGWEGWATITKAIVPILKGETGGDRGGAVELAKDILKGEGQGWRYGIGDFNKEQVDTLTGGKIIELGREILSIKEKRTQDFKNLNKIWPYEQEAVPPATEPSFIDPITGDVVPVEAVPVKKKGSLSMNPWKSPPPAAHSSETVSARAKRPKITEKEDLEEVNAIEFTAGTAGTSEASFNEVCCEDPNCKEYYGLDCGEKYMEPHGMQDPSAEDIEEISSVSNSGMEAGGKKKRRPQRSMIRQEELINDIVNYLLSNGSK